jgi:hypothetical protein
MKVEQKKFTKNRGWEIIKPTEVSLELYTLVLVFGSRTLLSDTSIYPSIKNTYPNADILMCSTAGEIIDNQVNDHSISLTAIQSDKINIKTTKTGIKNEKDSFQAGIRIASAFDTTNLKNVLIISDGQRVNGSDLVLGLQEILPKNIIITGGLAGDGSLFQSTLVGLNEDPTEGRIAAIGFYGSAFSVSYGSVGGWDPFGVERLITKSEGNILYELDGKPALDIYKRYLGEYASELPRSGLLFPLSIRMSEKAPPIVRTILAINEKDKSLVFAGNISEGSYAQLMKANLDRLIEGASDAATNSIKNNTTKPDLAILISCVGRKLVLDQRIEEEVEIIRNIYGADTALTGFYSYGEIAPSFHFKKCKLHNQTMTITTISEE